MKTTSITLLVTILMANFIVAISASAQCRDPWVTSAIKQVYGRSPSGLGEAGDCNIRLYNNGSWNNYNELVGYVKQVKNSGLEAGYAPAANGNSVMVVKQNGQLAVALLNGSGQVIATGGGNVIAAGGGNIISTGGGNIISTGGGNFSGLGRSTAGFHFSSGYQTLSNGQSRLSTSGKGSLIITK